MITGSSEGLNVAVLGSGIAGSTVARKLADSGLKVTVFECGFGVGGRTSTRVTRDEHKFSFDHGAQYIGQAKTKSFQSSLNEWETLGFVKKWEGRFASVDAIEQPDIQQDPSAGCHYVGYPAMNSICKNLLDHENIDVILQTRACCKFDESTQKWSLTPHGEDKCMGQFDWLVGSDRLSATNDRADLRHAPLSDFKSLVEPIVSIPILTLMIAFDSSLEIPFDGIRFEEGGSFGTLGWIARDTSKPGRDRTDGRECWVVQSGPQAAKELLESVKGASFENTREIVREKAKEILYSDFVSALPRLTKENISIPKTSYIVGHRWSAAFPLLQNSQDGKVPCFDDRQNNFVACGDYFDKVGRIEGAFLSGVSASETI
eukprot:CAMPEP_0178902234 /NCGR_PEP_ID=MMETSP0786-20121207/4490_1 /TAXON_ID=186022 /ORGANISM="Thalassionema frauenfeldii, Strain CCMP 1798" /LENGTH=373 /DNA_ID=CAMNT_0020573475 /DNA_START=26 /DNA_END=1144 /DNA_ORIENTATION=-